MKPQEKNKKVEISKERENLFSHINHKTVPQKILHPKKQEVKKPPQIKPEEEKVIANGNKFIGNISAYTAAKDETDSGDGITASGKHVKAHHTIACPRTYAFGTKVKIQGYGTYVCEDRGGAIKGNKFDIYMETKAAAFAFGRRNLTTTILR